MARLIADRPRLPKRLEDIPPFPATMTALLTLTPADENYRDDVIRIIERDPAVAAIVIHLANSALLGGLEKVDGLGKAVFRIGVRRAVSLVVASQLTRSFPSSVPAVAELWAHALFTAIGARTLAGTPAVRDADPERAYLSGLFHDIGLMGLATMYTAEYAEIRSSTQSEWEALEIERKIWQTDHTMIGVGLVATWGLPPYITQVIMDHHDAEPPANHPILSVVKFMDNVTDAALRGGRSIEDPVAPADLRRWVAGYRERGAGDVHDTGADLDRIIEDVRGAAAAECRQLGVSAARTGAK